MAVAGILPTFSLTRTHASIGAQGLKRAPLLAATLFVTAGLMAVQGAHHGAYAADPAPTKPATLLEATAAELAAEEDRAPQTQVADPAQAATAAKAAEAAKEEAAALAAKEAAKADAEADMTKALEGANQNVVPLSEAPASSKAAQSTAQTPKGLGGFSADPTKPIEIEADTLEVAQDNQTATFIGNVKAVQGTLILNAAKLKVTYEEASDGNTEITRIDANGAVHISSANDQSADGDWAIYQVKNETITMGDAVILRQGPNIIRGTRLAINLATGRAKVDASTTSGSTGGDGRVRGLFQPPKR